MAGDKCDRQTAMGNMDAYLNNPNDWAFGRLEQKKRGIKYDYVTLDQKQVVLVTVWSLLIGFFIGRGIYSYIFNVPYVRCGSIVLLLLLLLYLLLLLGWIDMIDCFGRSC